MLKAERPPSPAFAVTSTKRPLPGVVEQPVLPDGGDQDVREAVVVVVGDGDAHAVHLDRQPGGGGHVA